MWCSFWKTGCLSPGGVVKHRVLQEEPRRMATLGQHVLQGFVLEQGYGCVTSCVVLLVYYDKSFMIHLYVHLFYLYILHLGAV